MTAIRATLLTLLGLTVAHPLLTNMVWRDDERNFLKERDKVGGRKAMNNLNKVYDVDEGIDE